MSQDEKRDRHSLPRARSERGAAFLMIILSLSGIAVIAGSILPLMVNSGMDALQKSQKVKKNLKRLADSFEEHYYLKHSLPENANSYAFRNQFHGPIVMNSIIQDEWDRGQTEEADGERKKRSLRKMRKDGASEYDGKKSVKLYSVGEDGLDDEGEGDDIAIEVSVDRPAALITRQRLQDIQFALRNLPPIQEILPESLAEYLLDPGGTILGIEDFLFRPTLLAGDWSVDRASLHLGAEYEADGWGNTFFSVADALNVFSAGPDGIAFTADDISY